MKNTNSRRPKIIITTGDPAGCGPRITLEALACLVNRKEEFAVVGDRVILERFPLFSKVEKRVRIIDAQTPGIKNIKAGFASALTGTASLSYLKEAVRRIRQEKVSTLITAPVSKEAIQKVSPRFCGHTEFLARALRVRQVEMMMVSAGLRVVLLTRHIPFARVPKHLTRQRILECLALTYGALKKTFRIKHPKIAFASLNPHAGVDTFLAQEEKIIRSAIAQSRIPAYGPYPSDTLFLKKTMKKYDCIIALYHDQAMIPFKLLAFSRGVNVTIGLPIIRTSPAHGTAFDIMRQNKKPQYTSMRAAIELGRRLSS